LSASAVDTLDDPVNWRAQDWRRGHFYFRRSGRGELTGQRGACRRLGRPKLNANLRAPGSAAEWLEARRLVEEYAASLNLDLSFQNFAHELEHFKSEYSPPSGSFILAGEKGVFTGCVGLRQRSAVIAEIKRLYVVPTARGLGLGEALVRSIIDRGRQLNYARLVLDTLPTMHAARSLYEALGFKAIAPYRYNPVPGTAFLELELHDQ
jgi:GNAT superfamily N-acetyltransferase